MKFSWTSLLLVFAVIGLSVEAYKILAIFPTGGKSHFIAGHGLMRNLASRGHEVTVISPYPQKKPVKNYRDIETKLIMEVMKGFLDTILEYSEQGPLEAMVNLYELGLLLTNTTLSEPAVQKLMASGEKFDVVICEVFVSEALFGLAEHFNASLIGLSTMGASSWNTDMVGTPSPLSYVPNPFLPFTHRMTLLQRIINLAFETSTKFYFDNIYLPKQNALFRHFFPNSKLGLYHIRKNAALVLLNAHVTLGFPRPYHPNMIEVGGMFINRKRNPLPDDLQKFLDDAKDGAVYFSMGSNLKSKILPLDKREAILATFKSLKQKVLWKFEDPYLPGKSDNVFISDWFPQDDVLAHPNVKLFITHGGLLSTTESIYHGKPFVGIPMFGDQSLNMARSVVGGYAVTVEYKELTKETLSAAINKILNDPSYTNNVKVISERYRDQPVEPLDLATYWVEYIARHKGAPHLHSAAQELNFIQYHNLDAILILFGGLLVAFLLLAKLLLVLISKFLRVSTRKVKAKKH